jgi:putative DNA primase/helicase
VTEKRKRSPSAFALTDSGNAELIAVKYSDCLRFNHRTGKWFVWKGDRWCQDSKGEVFPLAKEAARARLAEAANIEDSAKCSEAAKWALESESQYRLKAALDLAKKESPISDAGDDWDSDPFLLGVLNGVVDLRTGILRESRPDDRMILRSPASYDPNAKCPRFERFLREVFAGDEDLIRFIQKAIGYSLTGCVTEQCLFFCYGEGANGKSTLLETVRDLLGAYACNLPFSSFEANARTSIPNDLAGLVSKRFVTASETSENVKLNEGRVKSLSGGDRCTARRLYGEFFEFDPTAKFWLSFNHKPRVSDDSHGFWRRVRLIGFCAKFDGAQQDKELSSKLRKEMSGILAWAIRGCALWQSEGLGTPAAIKTASEAYRSESDPLAAFLEECYESCPDGHIESSTLCGHYNSWAAENDERTMTPRDLAPRLRMRGYQDYRDGHLRVRAWRGLRPCSNNFINADTRTDADRRIQ